MRILLPPSEGKRTGGRGRPLDPSAGPLGAARRQVFAALARLVAGDPATAAAALSLPPGVAAEALAADRNLPDAPTTAALRRYAGVVYDGLAAERFTGPQLRVARRSLLIFSGLLGVVRGDEPVPWYRVPASARLPGIGVAASFWRPVLAEAMPALLGDALVIDLRSSDYAAMYRPPADTVEVRVLSPAPRGGYAVISYNSKLGKGKLARELIVRAAEQRTARTVDDVADAWLAAGGADAEMHRVRGRIRLDLRDRPATTPSL